MCRPAASPQARDTIAAHPLARQLIERLRGAAGAPVLDFASGSGRNASALRAAGLNAVCIDDRAAASDAPFEDVAGPFAAALSTHGLLHGTAAGVAAALASIAERLDAHGLLYATFGSTRDARFGKGERIDEFTFAPEHGDERGVPHAFFEPVPLRALLEAHFVIESLQERGVDAVAGSWAHGEGSLRGAVHWFAIARRRGRYKTTLGGVS